MLYSIILLSKNLNPIECNYKINDKKLLTIIKCFEQYRPERERNGVPVKVLTDHKSWKYFITTKKLTKRQACWGKFLSGFNFISYYTLSKKNQKIDSLTRYLIDLLLDSNDDHQHYLL